MKPISCDCINCSRTIKGALDAAAALEAALPAKPATEPATEPAKPATELATEPAKPTTEPAKPAEPAEPPAYSAKLTTEPAKPAEPAEQPAYSVKPTTELAIEPAEPPAYSAKLMRFASHVLVPDWIVGPLPMFLKFLGIEYVKIVEPVGSDPRTTVYILAQDFYDNVVRLRQAQNPRLAREIRFTWQPVVDVSIPVRQSWDPYLAAYYEWLGIVCVEMKGAARYLVVASEITNSTSGKSVKFRDVAKGVQLIDRGYNLGGYDIIGVAIAFGVRYRKASSPERADYYVRVGSIYDTAETTYTGSIGFVQFPASIPPFPPGYVA